MLELTNLRGVILREGDIPDPYQSSLSTEAKHQVSELCRDLLHGGEPVVVAEDLYAFDRIARVTLMGLEKTRNGFEYIYVTPDEQTGSMLVNVSELVSKFGGDTSTMLLNRARRYEVQLDAIDTVNKQVKDGSFDWSEQRIADARGKLQVILEDDERTGRLQIFRDTSNSGKRMKAAAVNIPIELAVLLADDAGETRHIEEKDRRIIADRQLEYSKYRCQGLLMENAAWGSLLADDWNPGQNPTVGVKRAVDMITRCNDHLRAPEVPIATLATLKTVLNAPTKFR